MRNEDTSGDKYDVTSLVAKPLYFGMVLNVMLPAAILFLCYYANNNYFVENRIPSMANALFYVFAAFAVAESGLAVWWRNKRFQEPMIHSEKTFERDLLMTLIAFSRKLFLLTTSISVWGFVYFLLTGRFQECAVFVILSFLVFQVVRPRYGSVRKLIAAQEELVEQGKLTEHSHGLL